MPSSTTTKRYPWTRSDDAAIKRGIRTGLTAKKIARTLTPKRSEGALRQRAYAVGISFKTSKTARRGRS